ncbi:MAG: flavodoxin-dependent (E)-4-hydroxy-3-methylbut-2-enyl-diphosphate synthase [Deltaproteobacteria bacterium]|nr:flavodoxin-dependent (E)-4-hydroxy-3-methylbut-2-enyl-diphosphate synthase [Deltaproteobacteria bacterium]
MVGPVPHGGNEPVRVWVSVPLGQIKKFAKEYETYRQSPEGKNLPLEGIEVIDDGPVNDGSGKAIPSFEDIPALFQAENPLLPVNSLENQNHSDPVMLRYQPESLDDPLLSPSIVLGALLLDGLGDAICLPLDACSAMPVQSVKKSADGSVFHLDPLAGGPAANSSLSETMKLAYNILQGARLRISKTEYIACPSCGRTQFDLQSTTRRIQEITSHLKGVKIAVMGCIVNGPGEMADADFGYVGTGSKKISLYVGKECVERNIPEEEAVSRLLALIKKHNRWSDASHN